MTPENLSLCDIRNLAEAVVQTIGPTAAAFACGCGGRLDVQRWASDECLPDDDELERLIVIREVLDVVVASDGPDIARMWFIGSSCGPDGNMSPSEAIRVRNYDDARGSAQRLAENA